MPDETDPLELDIRGEKEPWEDDFLRAYLSEHGTITKAAAAAGVTPYIVSARSKKSPAFKAQLEAAQEIIKDTVRFEVLRRALEPSERPVFQRGKLVGYIKEWDNRHLEWVAERMMPEEFHLPTRIEFQSDGDGVVNFKLELGDHALPQGDEDVTEADDK